MGEELKWIRMNFKELEEKYPGKYVAVLNNRVIASGTTGKEVIRQLKGKGIKENKPRFIHIPAAKTVFYRVKMILEFDYIEEEPIIPAILEK